MFGLRSTTLSPSSALNGMKTMSFSASLGGERAEVVADAVEHGLVVADEVHLVHGHDHVLHAEQRGDEGVALGLRQDALLRVDQDDREVGGATRR